MNDGLEFTILKKFFNKFKVIFLRIIKKKSSHFIKELIAESTYKFKAGYIKRSERLHVTFLIRLRSFSTCVEKTSLTKPWRGVDILCCMFLKIDSSIKIWAAKQGEQYSTKDAAPIE